MVLGCAKSGHPDLYQSNKDQFPEVGGQQYCTLLPEYFFRLLVLFLLELTVSASHIFLTTEIGTYDD